MGDTGVPLVGLPITKPAGEVVPSDHALSSSTLGSDPAVPPPPSLFVRVLGHSIVLFEECMDRVGIDAKVVMIDTETITDAQDMR